VRSRNLSNEAEFCGILGNSSYGFFRTLGWRLLLARAGGLPASQTGSQKGRASSFGARGDRPLLGSDRRRRGLRRLSPRGRQVSLGTGQESARQQRSGRGRKSPGGMPGGLEERRRGRVRHGPNLPAKGQIRSSLRAFA